MYLLLYQFSFIFCTQYFYVLYSGRKVQFFYDVTSLCKQFCELWLAHFRDVYSEPLHSLQFELQRKLVYVVCQSVRNMHIVF